MEKKIISMAIVVIAYNRPDSLLRLLNSLEKVDYEGHKVPLIISIDYSGDDSVYKAAKAFNWKAGEKKIIQHASNLGLKKHVLTCGDLVKDYDALIVLEDDLVVSPAMYSYAWRAVEKYKDDDNIAAISLYSKGWNETAWKPFVPSPTYYDTYFVQTAESWGQVWMRNEWLNFRKWYEHNNEPFSDAEGIPKDVCEWDSKSWKKYHIKYCVDNNKYTVYPYRSLTTCIGEAGEHVKINNSDFQVPLMGTVCRQYSFADFENDNIVKYDVYLERIYHNQTDICMDLYGQKNFKSFRYIITPRILNYKIVATYGLSLRPHEENIRMNAEGDYFYKYDLNVQQQNPIKIRSEMALRYYNYIDFTGVTNEMLVTDIAKHLLRVIKRRIKKRFRRRK